MINLPVLYAANPTGPYFRRVLSFMDDPLLPIIVLVILILINAFFAAAEIAVISLSETKLRRQAEEGDKKATKTAPPDAEPPTTSCPPSRSPSHWPVSCPPPSPPTTFPTRWSDWLTEDMGFTAIPAGDAEHHRR